MEPEDDQTTQRLVDFGQRVRALRRAAGLTQEALAEASGLHRVTIGLIERAQREVGVTAVLPLALGLKVSPGALFGDTAG
jgi:transcriptional regulator with XRE-family HTH domain